jgi:C1q domain
MGYIGNSLLQQVTQPATQFFSGNGSTTSFTLNQTPQSVYTVEVIVNNVQQNPQTSYYITNNSLIFYSPPPSGSNNIYVNYNPVITQVGQPGYGTVSTNQLGVITNINSALGNLTLTSGGTLIMQTGANNTVALTLDQNQNIALSSLSTTTYKISGGGSIPNSTGTQLLAMQFAASDTPSSNTDFLQITNTRTATGTSWVTRGWRLQQKVDATWMGYMQFNANGNTGGISFGAGFTTTDPNTIPEVMRINSSGQFTIPNQPVFGVYVVSGSAPWNAGLTGIITYNATLTTDPAGGMNNSNGRYTAQVAGKYFFSFTAFTNSDSSAPNQIQMIKNGGTTVCRSYTAAVNGYTVQGTLTAHVQMAVGDYIYVQCDYGNLHQNVNCYFSGHLIG